MLNKDVNNQGSWKSRLDELDNLPDEMAPAKNMSWNKLHARLHEKKANSKTYWYWMAASILLAISLTWFLIDMPKKQYPLVQHFKNEQHPVVINRLKDTGPQKTSIEKTTPAKIDNLLSAKRSNEKQLILPAKLNPSKQEITTNEQLIITVENSIPVTDSVYIAIVPKKALRVVHLNDITDRGQTGITESDNNKNELRRFIKYSNKGISSGNKTSGSAAEHVLIRNLNSQK